MDLLKPLADAIKANKKITFFLGAGISTSCGIPDFRSPKTGLYANLKKLNLPYPEAVFDIDYFKDTPQAFYALAHELYPGTFLPSKFHFFIKLVQDKKLLKRVYTQNIDTLERLAGVEGDYIVEAHGSFAKNHCIDCRAEMSSEDFKKHIFKKDHNERLAKCADCGGYVKPDIVFFGEALPARFFELWDEDADDVDVAIVAGSSLTVYPFAALPSEVGRKCLRVLVNKEAVGDFASKKRATDILALDDCDTIAETIVDLLGWRKEFDALIAGAQAEFRNTKDAETEAAEVAEKIKEEIKSKKPSGHKESPTSDKPNSDKPDSGSPTDKPTDKPTDQLDDLDDALGKLKI